MSDPLGGYLGQGSEDDPLNKYVSNTNEEPPDLLKRPDNFTFPSPPIKEETTSEKVARTLREHAAKTGQTVNPLALSFLTTSIKVAEAIAHPKEALSAIKQVFNRRGELVGTIGGGLKTGAKALGQTLANPTQPLSPEQIQTGTFLWENILAPFAIRPAEAAFSRNLDPLNGQPIGSSKSPEEALKAGEEAVGNYGAALLGNAVGRAITRAGKATDAIKTLSGVNSLDQLPTRLPYLDATKQFEIASELTKINTGTKFIQGVTEGSTGGAFLGLATGKTPQEQWENAFNYALAGSILGGIAEGASAKNTSSLSADALRLANEKQRQIIMSLPPKNAARAAAQLMDGLPIDEIMMRQIPEGEIGVLQGVEKLSGNMRDRPNVITHKNPEGGFDLLISNDKGKGVPNPNVYLESAPEDIPVSNLEAPDITSAIEAPPTRNIPTGPINWDTIDPEVRKHILHTVGDLDPIFVDDLASKSLYDLNPAEQRLIDEALKEFKSVMDDAATNPLQDRLVYKDDRGNILGRIIIDYADGDPLHKATKFTFEGNVEDLGHGTREIPLSDEIKTQLFDEAQRLGYDPLNLIKPKTQYEAIAQEALKGPIEGFEEKFLANINKLESDLAHQELALSQRPNDPALIEDINILQKRLEYANEQLARERQRLAKSKENDFNNRMLDRYSPSNLTKEDIVSFVKDGYVENQVVFHNGKTYSFQESIGKNQLSLQDINTGEMIIANRKEVFSTPRIEKAYRTADGTVIWEGPTGDVRRAPKNLDELYGENVLSPAEAEIVNENIDKEVKASRKLGEDLARRISASGHIIEPKGDGTYNVSNRHTGELIKNISSIDELKELSPNLGDVFDIGDGSGGVFVRPPSTSPSDWGPSPAEKYNPARAFKDWLVIKTNKFQPPDIYLGALESKFPELRTENAGLLTQGLLELNRANLRLRAIMKEPLERLDNLFDKAIKGKVRQDRLPIIYGYRETASSAEIRAGALRGKPLNPEEIAFSDTHSKALGDGKSLKHSLDYLLERAILRSREADELKVEKSLKQWEAAHGELSLAQRNFVDDLTDKQSLGFNEFDTYPVIADMDAILNKGLTQEEYKVANKMTPYELTVAQMIGNEYDKLAVEFGIKDARMLLRYNSHILKYENGLDIHKTSIYPHLSAAEREFFGAQERMGYRTELNRDPFDTLVRYARAGYRAKYLSETLERVRDVYKRAPEIIANSDYMKARMTPSERSYYALGLKRYLDDQLAKALGGPLPSELTKLDASAKAIQKILNVNEATTWDYAKAMAYDFNPLDPTTLQKNIEFSTQGGKMMAGIRDAFSGTLNSNTLFGPKVTKDILDYIVFHHKNGTLLRELGITPGITIDLNETANLGLANRALEIAEGNKTLGGYIYSNLRNASKVYDKIRDVSFAISLQPLVYEKMHAATYSVLKRRALENINLFNEGKLSRAKFENNIDLSIYPTSVIREFNNQLENYKYEQAASLLGEHGGYMVNGLYGMGNSPQFMWSKYGRLFGQFSQWGIRQLNLLADISSRGSQTAKAKRLAFVLGSWAALNQVSDETGVDLSSWSNSFTNALVRPGPFADMVYQTLKYATNRNEASRNYAMYQLKNFFAPRYGIMIPVPLYLRNNALDAIERYQQGDPTPVALWRLLGGSVFSNSESSGDIAWQLLSEGLHINRDVISYPRPLR